MYARLDQLGKTVLRDLFAMLGAVETEAEVPPTDAQTIDLWFVPDPERLRSHPDPLPALLREMTSEPAAAELFGDTLDPAAFHGYVRKRYQWHHVLELREKHTGPLPVLWIVSAGRPESVMNDFGFVPAPDGPPGHYATSSPGWRVHLIVASERRRRATRSSCDCSVRRRCASGRSGIWWRCPRTPGSGGWRCPGSCD